MKGGGGQGKPSMGWYHSVEIVFGKGLSDEHWLCIYKMLCSTFMLLIRNPVSIVVFSMCYVV